MNTSKIAESLARSDGGQWHFIAGIVLALGCSLVISGIAPAERPSNFYQLIGAGGCFFFGSFWFTCTGWVLARLDQLARSEGERSVEGPVLVKQRLVAAALGRISLNISCGAICCALAFAVLFVR